MRDALLPQTSRYLRPQLVGLTALVVLLGCVAPSHSDDAKAGPADIFEAARAAVADYQVTKSMVIGSNDEAKNRKFTELKAIGGILIGFDCGVGKWFDIETVYALRPIYLTARGEMYQADHGTFSDFRKDKRLIKTRVERTVRVRARPGYAVAGMTIRSGLNFNGLHVKFMRINGTTLDPQDFYTGDWVGDRSGGSERTIDPMGTPVVGVYGSADDDHVYGFGLIFMRKAPTVEAPNVVPPKVERPTTDPPKVKRPTDPPTPAPKVERPTAPLEPDESTSVAPAPIADGAATPPAEGMNWLPAAIFAGVALPIFVVLLVSSSRKRQPAQQPIPVARDRRDPTLTREPSGPWETRPPRSADDITAKSPPAPTPKSPAPAAMPPAAPEPLAERGQGWPEGADPITAKPRPAPLPPLGPVDPRPAPSGPLNEPIPPWTGASGYDLIGQPTNDQTKKACKEVAGLLFSIAGLQLVCGLIAVAVVPSAIAGGQVPKQAMPLLAGEIIGIALLFAALGYWAFYQPLPAAVIGLVIYGGLFLLNLSTNPQWAMNGMIVRICIIIGLVRAISTAAKASNRSG